MSVDEIENTQKNDSKGKEIVEEPYGYEIAE
jgi:hypothetical protein